MPRAIRPETRRFKTHRWYFLNFLFIPTAIQVLAGAVFDVGPKYRVALGLVAVIVLFAWYRLSKHFGRTGEDIEKEIASLKTKLSRQKKLFSDQIFLLEATQALFSGITAEDIRYLSNCKEIECVFKVQSRIDKTVRFIAAHLQLIRKKQDYRVTLMEPSKRGLQITAWAPWRKVKAMPVMLRDNRALRKGYGVAGMAWDKQKKYYIEDTDKEQLFHHWDHSVPMRTKSMVSIPLCNTYSENSLHDCLGVLNIDTTARMHFKKPDKDKVEHDDIELIQPIILKLILYLKLRKIAQQLLQMEGQ